MHPFRKSGFTVNLIILHFIVFIWGFTGILGKYITLSSTWIVWYRMLIALPFLFLYLLLIKGKIIVHWRKILLYCLVGVCIALHWIAFFESIKLSNVSIAVSCMATTSLFTALLEPIFFKRRIVWYELVIGLMVLIGIYMIFQFESTYFDAILIALFSAALAALFTVVNAILVKTAKASTLAFYELGGGWILISIYFLFKEEFNANIFNLNTQDLISLMILGIICTAFAFMMGIQIMKTLTPFTVSVSINLEPVYSIILALIIFGESEKMTAGFYTGAIVIIISVLLNAYLKGVAWRKNFSIR